MKHVQLKQAMESALLAYGFNQPNLRGATRGILDLQANQYVLVYSEQPNPWPVPPLCVSKVFPLKLGVDPKHFMPYTLKDAVYFLVDADQLTVSPIDFFAANRLINEAPDIPVNNPEAIVENLNNLLAIGQEKGLWTQLTTNINPYDWDGWRLFFKSIANPIMTKVVDDSILRLNDFFVDAELVA